MNESYVYASGGYDFDPAFLRVHGDFNGVLGSLPYRLEGVGSFSWFRHMVLLSSSIQAKYILKPWKSLLWFCFGFTFRACLPELAAVLLSQSQALFALYL
jgi:hypothetical protein